VAYESFKLVTKANPEAVRVYDSSGRLPFHYAVGNINIKLDVVERLLEGYPDAIITPDGDGKCVCVVVYVFVHV